MLTLFIDVDVLNTKNHDKMAAPQTFSVVIATYNRARLLEECLGSLISQKYPNDRFEVIVVDDGSSDDTGDAVAAMKKGSPVSIRYLVQENQGPGLARNLGVSKATGKIIAFMDDDDTADENWLSDSLKHLDDERTILGGTTHIRREDDSLLSQYEAMNNEFQEAGKKSPKYVPTRNMFIRKKAFEELGGFRDLRTGEDMDLCFRGLSRGYRLIGAAGDCIIWEKSRANLKEFMKKYLTYGFNRVYLMRSHPQLTRFSLMSPGGIVLSAAPLAFMLFFSPLLAAILSVGYILAVLSFASRGYMHAKERSMPLPYFLSLDLLKKLMYLLGQSQCCIFKVKDPRMLFQGLIVG